MDLTPKQEAFAQAVASGKNQSDAYRASFNVRVNTKPETVNEAASRLMADSKVAARVTYLRSLSAKAAAVTLEGHLDDLQELRDAAVRAKQYSAAIAAETARGKAAGLYVEKREHSGSLAVTLALTQDDADL